MTKTPGTATFIIDAPKKPCHNCRRSRRRCDRSLPHCNKCVRVGEECLGYQNHFSWVNGVASRGKMVGKSFGDVQAPISNYSHKIPVVELQGENFSTDVTPARGQALVAVNRPLTDPFLQDLDQHSRFYLFYFDTQVCKNLVIYDVPNENPFRELISFTREYQVLFQVIIATSALHLSNKYRKLINSNLKSESLPNSSKVIASTTSSSQSEISRPDIYQHALIAKHRALKLLYVALEGVEEANMITTLASVLFFINLELIDSGKNDWRPHVEGAGRLMECLASLPYNKSTANGSSWDCLVSDCLVIGILGKTLTRPTRPPAPQPSALDIPSILKNAEANQYLSCPAEILQIVMSVPQLLWDINDTSAQIPTLALCQTDHSSLLLKRIEAFDASTWAANLQRFSPREDWEKRCHVASAHKAAASIYITDAFRPAGEFVNDLEHFVTDIIEHLEFITADDDLFKATSWATFVAGAAATDIEQQRWVIRRLDMFWERLPWGYVQSAIEILEAIWQRRSSTETAVSWVQELRSLGVDLLVV